MVGSEVRVPLAPTKLVQETGERLTGFFRLLARYNLGYPLNRLPDLGGHQKEKAAQGGFSFATLWGLFMSARIRSGLFPPEGGSCHFAHCTVLRMAGMAYWANRKVTAVPHTEVQTSFNRGVDWLVAPTRNPARQQLRAVVDVETRGP